MRTTVDLDAPILRELKRLQKIERLALGRLVSDLLGQALAARRAHGVSRPAFHWISRPMHARINLADKDALYAALDPDPNDGRRDEPRP